MATGGSLEDLFCFSEIAFIYKVDSSTIRRKVLKGEFIKEVDVKKFGKTWVMTKTAMFRVFGEKAYNSYISEKRDFDYLFMMGEISAQDLMYAKDEGNDFL